MANLDADRESHAINDVIFALNTVDRLLISLYTNNIFQHRLALIDALRAKTKSLRDDVARIHHPSPQDQN